MKSTQILARCGLLLAMGTALSLIPIFEMPFGGSVTLLSMLPICLVGLMFGAKWGFGTAFVYSVIQLMLSKCFAWGLSPMVLVICIFADYIVAFTALGITGFFRGSRARMCMGIFLALLMRMICHYISGVTIWAETAPEGWTVWTYSLAYNVFYMLPELVFTMAGAMAISAIPQMKRTLGI